MSEKRVCVVLSRNLTVLSWIPTLTKFCSALLALSHGFSFMFSL